MNLIEQASKFDPNVTYPVTAVNDAILDLNVVGNILEATLPGGATTSLGRWTGPDPLQVQSFNLDSTQAIHTIMNDGVDHVTPQARFDLETKVVVLGSGVHSDTFQINNFSDVRFDYFNESLGQMYSLAATPSTVTLTTLRVVTSTGVVLTANTMWSSSYSLYKTLNRGVAHVGDGLLSGTPTLIITHTYPSEIMFIGFNFKNLRSDYPSTSMKVEYTVDGTNWVVFENKSLAGNIMGHHEKLLANQIQVLGVRLTCTGTEAAGCGYFNVLTNGWGVVEKFTPINFHPDYFNVVEDATSLTVTPNAVGVVTDFKALGVKDYLRASVELVSGQLNPTASGVGLIKFNKIERNTLSVMNTLPAINLPRGKYKYRFTVNDSIRGKGFYYLAIQGNLFAFNAIHHNDPGVDAANRTSVIEGEGEFDLCVNEFITLNYSKPSGFNLPATTITGTKLATIEFWKIAEPTEEFLHPLGKPSAEMICSPFVKIYEALYLPSAARTFDALFTSPIANGYGHWNSVGDHVVVHIAKPFRLWRAALAVSSVRYHGLLKITYYGNGEVDLSGRQFTLAGAEGVWELATKDMPAGIYKFEYASAIRVDGAWFFETIASPVYSEPVYSNKLLPMTVTPDQGQAVYGAFLSAGYEPVNAFGAGVSVNGWASGTHYATQTPGSPQFIELDVGKIITIDSIAIYNRTGGDIAGVMSFRIEGYVTNTSSWVTLATIADRVVTGAGAVTRHENLGTFAYRNFRIVAISRFPSGPNYVAIGKIELYNSNENVTVDNTMWL